MDADWYKWDVVKYRKRTRHLSNDEDLAYRRLIDEYMITREPLPDDDVALAKIAGLTPDAWAIARAKVVPFFRHGNGFLSHDECDKNLADQDAASRNMSAKGKKGAEMRWKNRSDKQGKNSAGNAPAIAQPMPDDSRERIENRDNISSVDKDKESLSTSDCPKPKNKISIMFDFEKNKFSGIEEKEIELWKEAYPAVDVRNELNKMEAWLAANPKNRKNNYPRFINNWLSKAQDKAPRVGGSNGAPSNNSLGKTGKYAEIINKRNG